ncbi:MAG: DNA internalization-related competence protein ComEC/Rec2 [Chloroflexota bacterium]
MGGSPITATVSTPSTVDSRYFLALVGGAGWLAGIWLAGATRLAVLVWLSMAVPLVVGAAWLWQRGRMGLALAFGAAVTLGGGRYVAAQPPLESDYIQYYNGARGVEIGGLVVGEPVVHDTRTQLLVAVREITLDGTSHPVMGTIQVETGRYPFIPYGATVTMAGDLSAPLTLGSPGYAAYLERRGILSVMDFPQIDVDAVGGGSAVYRLLLRVKARGREVIAASLPEPHAALLTGILLGDDSGIPRQLEQDFRETGMTHIIAISGFNIAVIIALLDHMMAPLFPRRTAALVIMLFVALYAILVGASASVVRAAVMGISYLIGRRLLGRPTLAIAGLFTAAFLMTLSDPNTLWDVGFQLSFAATLGLMLYAGSWSRGFARRVLPLLPPRVGGRVTALVSEVLLVTLAAQVLTLPLILYHFGRLSLAGLPANILVLPAQTAVMATGGLTLAVGLLWPSAGQVVGLLAWPFLHYTISAIQLLAQLPFASIPLPLSATGLIGVYLVIAAVTMAAKTRRETDQPQSLSPHSAARPAVLLGGVVLGGVLLAGWRAGHSDNLLRAAFLDVGQGDATWIQTPHDRQLLVDGGRYPSVILSQLGRRMPFWDHSIDVVIATHPDADHIAGLVDVIERYQVSMLITNGADPADDPDYAALLAAAEARGSVVHVARKGEVLLLDEGVRLEIIHAGKDGGMEDRNDASVVARLRYGELTVLLTGDAGGAAEAAMLRDGEPLTATVLKAGHHGANTSSSEAFLRVVSPQVMIISAGRGNSYGHPHPAMLARAAAVGATVLRTDELGTLELTSDGTRVWWMAEHENVTILDAAQAP